MPGARFAVDLESVIVATGQEAVERLAVDFGVGMRGGRVAVDLSTGRTDNPRVWAGGDLVNGGREVVHAVEEGKIAARSIAAELAARAEPTVAAEPAARAGAPAIESASAVSAVPEAAPGVSLAVEMAGIRSPNPFWLASGPPTNTGEMVARAFEAGWGGAVWKTVGDPITNVTARLGSLDLDGRRMVGLSKHRADQRPPDRDEPGRDSRGEAPLPRPRRRRLADGRVAARGLARDRPPRQRHGRRRDRAQLRLPARDEPSGDGLAVGQVPDYLRMIVEWAKEVAEIPVLVKLTPNITDITVAARAAREGGADGIALINTINSLIGVDLETWPAGPAVRGRGTHGGYTGPAVKPIALNMVSACARDPRVGIPISGVGGIDDWRDAVQFLLLGGDDRPACTGRHAPRLPVVGGMIDGLAGYLAERGLTSPAELVGRVLPAVGDWGQLDLSYSLQGAHRRGHLHPLQPLLPGLARTAPTRRSGTNGRTVTPR